MALRLRTGGQRKPSYLEEHRIDFIDYKDTKVLQRFLSPQGKILPRRLTRLTTIQQHALTQAVKRARHLAMIPYSSDAEAY
jgi:small subunit ribosomal protein S18